MAAPGCGRGRWEHGHDLGWFVPGGLGGGGGRWDGLGDLKHYDVTDAAAPRRIAPRLEDGRKDRVGTASKNFHGKTKFDLALNIQTVPELWTKVS